MAKLVYVCLRNRERSDRIINRIKEIAGAIIPDNIVPEPAVVFESAGIIIGVFNPHKSVRIRGASLCLGPERSGENWDELDLSRPDGAYVLFRGNESRVQILSDSVASRTVWYFMNADIFIAATSQRALIMLLGNFEFNRDLIPWMLSTGSLGLVDGWDRRIGRLNGDSVINLDRNSWVMDIHRTPARFKVRPVSDGEHENTLRQALDATFSKTKLDYSQWVLLLSGGYDSRSILGFLKDRSGMRTITWGMRSAQFEKSSDAYIAKELADHYRLAHSFFETDLAQDDIATVFQRYLICGDGECDHISGYLDGFAIWKTLYEKGIKGVIRGDEGFGWVAVASPLDVRLSLGLALWSDFSNLKDLRDFDLPEQKMPETLLQQDCESLETWRDRLYHEFRIPVVLAALSDLKLSYVEIANPLLSKDIIETVRTLPDDLRTDKKLFRSIARSISPGIRFSKHQSLADKGHILKSANVVSFLKMELEKAKVESVLPRDFLDYVIENMTVENGLEAEPKRTDIVGIGKRFFPKAIRSKFKQIFAKPRMDLNILAFRCFLIVKMHKILDDSVAKSSGLEA